MVITATKHKLDPTLRHFIPLHAAYRPADLCKSRQNRFIFSGADQRKSPNPALLEAPRAETKKGRKQRAVALNRTASLRRRRGSISRILFPRVTTEGNDHSSGPAVAGGIVRPYPRTRPGRTARPSDRSRDRREGPPIWSCSGWGLSASRLSPGWSELLPRRFTLTAAYSQRREKTEAVCFLWHFPPITRGRR